MTSTAASFPVSNGIKSSEPAPAKGNTAIAGDALARKPLSEIDINVPPADAPRIRICVFCGARPGASAAHIAAARRLAQLMHESDISLVYGGGTHGLMGEVARTLVSLSGPDSVHGIIPGALVQYERDGDYVTTKENSSGKVPDAKIYGRTTIVKDMHARKRMMAKEVLAGGPGSGFVALSGGYGTIEELMEIVTWNQLGIHDRGIVVLNIEGYWDGLLTWIRGAVDAGFVGASNKEIIKEAKTAEEAVLALKNYQAAKGRFNLKWGSE
ncbi:lysine decarboxylase-like protein-like protein [Bisporella sp. PMI_857]|nr:lysine decarboxylase-like protein-like protein [Bisporella sp. PMI_857]